MKIENKPIPLAGTSLGKGRNSANVACHYPAGLDNLGNRSPGQARRGQGDRNLAFTLVELIIVITILAILATIGFMSFQSYTIDARDANRITSLKTMSDGLQIYQAKKSTLPDPDAQTVNIMSGGLLISTQGYAGPSVLQKLKASDIKDPSDNTYYTYAVNSDKTKYQLLSMLENNTALALNNNLLNETYARDYTSRYAYTTGNKVGVFFSGTTNTPIQETTSGNLVLTDTANANKAFKVMFSNQTTNSGTIISSGSSLPAIVVTESNTLASTSTTVTLSCTGQAIGTSITISGVQVICAGIFSGSNLMTTPGGCSNAISPTCGNWSGKDGVSDTWTNINSYCENLIFGGKTDWYLPNINELIYLRSISSCNDGDCSTLENNTIKGLISYNMYRSSTSGSINGYQQYNMQSGILYNSSNSSSFVRCIRKD